jgi:hypothetical protein
MPSPYAALATYRVVDSKELAERLCAGGEPLDAIRGGGGG